MNLLIVISRQIRAPLVILHTKGGCEMNLIYLIAASPGGFM